MKNSIVDLAKQTFFALRTLNKNIRFRPVPYQGEADKDNEGILHSSE